MPGCTQGRYLYLHPTCLGLLALLCIGTGFLEQPDYFMGGPKVSTCPAREGISLPGCKGGPCMNTQQVQVGQFCSAFAHIFESPGFIMGGPIIKAGTFLARVGISLPGCRDCPLLEVPRRAAGRCKESKACFWYAWQKSYTEVLRTGSPKKFFRQWRRKSKEISCWCLFDKTVEEAEKLQKSFMSLHGFLKDKPMEMSVGNIV